MSEPKKIEIQVISPLLDDLDNDIKLVDLSTEVRKDLLENRKKELSGQISKLYHKADQIGRDRHQAIKNLRKLDDSLARTLEKISRLQAGDWAVLRELDKETGQDGKG